MPHHRHADSMTWRVAVCTWRTAGVRSVHTTPWKGQALEAVDRSAADRRSRNAHAEDLAFLESSLRDDLVRLGYASADDSHP